MMMAPLVFAGLLSIASAHTAFLTKSRMSYASSTTQPYNPRKKDEVHVQIGGNQSVIVKWCSAHYYTFYVSVIPAKYEHHLYGTGKFSHPLKEYAGMLNEYMNEAPAGADTIESEPRVHGISKSPLSSHFYEDGSYQAQCNNGICPDDVFPTRIQPGDPDWHSHPEEVPTALFRYNPKYTTHDKRVSYHSKKFPWLRMASKFVQPANLHNDYDLIKVAINNTLPDDGQHYLIHWFADVTSTIAYSDVMDVYVHPEPIDESLTYGVGTDEYKLSRIDHCQWGGQRGFRRALTTIRDATETPKECEQDLRNIGVPHTNDVNVLSGAIGINVVPITRPEFVGMTVERAIEDVNAICVAECTKEYGDGGGRCRQHDNTNGLDVCWLHNGTVTSSEGETCALGTGALVHEPIPVFLCPDASIQAEIGQMVDTTLPNIPFLQEFAVGEETKRDATGDKKDKSWYRHYGASAQTPIDWHAWEEKTVAHGGRHNGTRCAENVNIGWSPGNQGLMTFKDAIELCTANYPSNCGGVSVHHGDEVQGVELVSELRFEDPSDLTLDTAPSHATGGDEEEEEEEEATKCLTRHILIQLPESQPRLTLAEVEAYDGAGNRIYAYAATQGNSATVGPGEMSMAGVDLDRSNYVLLWYGGAFYNVDLDGAHDVQSVKIISRSATGGGPLVGGTVTLYRESDDSHAQFRTSDKAGGTCASWTINSALSEYDFSVADSESAPTTPAPTPAPAVTAQSSSEAAPVAGGPSSAASAYFDGSALSFLSVPMPLTEGGDFLISFWFKAASDHSSFSDSGSSTAFSEGAGLVDATGGYASRGWGVMLTKNGVSFGVTDLRPGGMANVDSVLRSHTGHGKTQDYQRQHNRSPPPAEDASWHFCEAKRVGPHVTLKLDGLIVSSRDNGPGWEGSPQNPVLTLGKYFHGLIDEVKVYSYPLAYREQLSAFEGDRNGDGVADNEAAANPATSCGGDFEHRYVTIFTPPGGGGSLDLREVSIHDSDGAFLVPTGASVSKPYSANHNAGMCINRAMDACLVGGESGETGWLEIDLGAPKKIGKVTLWPRLDDWSPGAGTSIGLYTSPGRSGEDACVIGIDSVNRVNLRNVYRFAPPPVRVPVPKSMRAPPINLHSGLYNFVPCLYEDLKEQTFWVGPSDAATATKEVSCPYCVSCKVQKALRGSLRELRVDQEFTNRGEASNTVVLSRSNSGWRSNNGIAMVTSPASDLGYCDPCNSEDQTFSNGNECADCITLSCRVSQAAEVDGFPGLLTDPSWTTFTKPASMTKPFSRSLTEGHFLGQAAPDDKAEWEVYARVTFQEDHGSEYDDRDCEDLAVASFGTEGVPCQGLGGAYCTLSGEKGPAWNDGRASSSFEQCSSRYLYISLPYPEGSTDNKRLTLGDILLYDENDDLIAPVAGWSTHGGSIGQGVIDALSDSNPATFYLEWQRQTLSLELDLGSAKSVRKVVLTRRANVEDSLAGATVSLSAERYGGVGSACHTWSLSTHEAVYTLTGDSDMFNVCCPCGGGRGLKSKGWLTDHGYEFGQHGLAPMSFGWQCQIEDALMDVNPNNRDFTKGFTRNQNWGDCADGSKNEWNIEVPKNGAYLVSIHSQNIGAGAGKIPFSVENVRSIGESQAMAIHLDGTTEILHVDVMDGKLTLSTAHHIMRNMISWIQIEMLKDSAEVLASPDQDVDSTWLPSSSEAYWELELDEPTEPVGLVVVRLPSTSSMVSGKNTRGTGAVLPSFRTAADDDSRADWFFDPPRESLPLTMGFKFGAWLNLSSEVDQWGYPKWCDYNIEEARQGRLYDWRNNPSLGSPIHSKSFKYLCSMTPSSPEFSEGEFSKASDVDDGPLSSSRWWGHTGGRPGRGAVVSVSDFSCSDPAVDCGAEPGAYGADETVCEVVTSPSICDYEQYNQDGQTGNMCPHEIDCKGATGRYLRVRLPGARRLLSVEQVDVYKQKPSNLPSTTAASDKKRQMACYALEAQQPPSAGSPTFLEDIKILPYETTENPQDPIFYSSCLMYEKKRTFLPLLANGGASAGGASGTPKLWNFSGYCLDCDSYFQNYLNASEATGQTPQWWFNDICEDCDIRYGFKQPEPRITGAPSTTPAPTNSPAPTPQPSTVFEKAHSPVPTAAQRNFEVSWVIGRGDFPDITAMVGDTITFVLDPSAHSVVFMQDEAAWRQCDFSEGSNTQRLAGLSPIVFTVPSSDAKPTYFVGCSVGEHCEFGQKFRIQVPNWHTTTPSPTVTPPPSLAPSATPEAGAMLVGPANLEVTEGAAVGSSSSSTTFTLALATAPLSDVAVTFTSSQGFVTITPPKLVFTWQDYGKPQTVTVAAVNDDADQGSSPTYADAVAFGFESADSSRACADDRNPSDRSRRPCNQAVAYDGFVGIADMPVLVTDDDAAGVVVSETSVAATFNNYGDSLAAAEYTIALSSKPSADVVITLGGFSSDAYSTLSSSTFGYSSFSKALPTLTIPQNQWARQVVVRVELSAPSADRPVCGSDGGGTQCATLNGLDTPAARFTLTHAVASGDGAFEGVTVASVAVRGALVYDAQEPPVLIKVQFDDLLNALTLTFDSDTDRANLSGKFLCSEVLDLTLRESFQLFGKGSRCAFTSPTSLKVLFGRGATVTTGQALRIKDGTVKSGASSSEETSLFMHGAANAAQTVAAPATPTVPRVVLSASSAKVGLCDDLKLDGSASQGSGGRGMAFEWSVAGVSSHGTANLTAALNDADGFFRARVPSAAMPRGSTFTVTLKATNFLNEVGTASVVLEKLQLPAPTLRIQGENPVTTATRSGELRLAVAATLPKLTCLADDSKSSLANAKMSWEWREDGGLFTTDELSGTSRNPRVLVLPAGSLAAATTYSFTVKGFMTDDVAVANEATVSVQVGQQDLKAVIKGVKQVGRDVAFALDGGGSTDPDEVSGAMLYSWQCSSCGPTFNSLERTSATLSVPAQTLVLGAHEVTLATTKGSRTAVATTQVEVVAGAPPSVEIQPLSKVKYNVDEKFVQLVGSVGSAVASTEWSAVDSDVATPFLNKGQAVATVGGLRMQAVVSLAGLTPGGTYTFKFTAQGSASQASYSTVSLTMNEAPSSGSVVVSPSRGYALDTSFSFSALGWVDEDYPLTYIFGTAEVALGTDGKVEVDGGKLSPFGNKRSDATYDGVTLAQGVVNETVGAFVAVVDSYGAQGSSTGQVVVGTRPLSVKQLTQISENKTKDAIEQGDANAAKQVLQATCGGLKTATDDEQGRRRLLAGGADDLSSKEALRASVLTNLEDTYAITDATQPDMASVLAVLKSVVEVPSEVNGDVAARSLQLLKTVLEASLASGVGIDSTAATNVGASLSHLLGADAFNATKLLFDASAKAASFAHAATVAQVVALLSACQLDGAPNGVGSGLQSSGDLSLYALRGSPDTLTGSSATVVSLSFGAADDPHTSFQCTQTKEALGLGSYAGSLDVRLATFKTNPYAAAVGDGFSTADAAGSRLDQGGAGNSEGGFLLRSKVTLAEVALSDGSGSAAPLELTGLTAEAPVKVTLQATVPFDADAAAYDKTFACNGGNEGDTIDAGCPLTTFTHTCDMGSHNGGAPYAFTYNCPKVVPTCLWWDESSSSFSGSGCVVAASGYTADAVTCECTHLTNFVLGAALTEGAFTMEATANPSTLPTPQPSNEPTAALAVGVDVTMELAGTARPATASDVVNLKAAIVDELGVTTSSVKGFAVTSAPSRRRRLSSSSSSSSPLPAEKTRRLTSYTWAAAFAVVTTDFATTAALEAQVSALASADFSVVDSDLAVVPGSVGVAARVPSPTAAPVVTPTATPPTGPGSGAGAAAAVGDGSSGSSGSSSEGPDAATLGAVVAGVLALVLTALACFAWARRSATVKNKGDLSREREGAGDKDDEEEGGPQKTKNFSGAGKGDFSAASMKFDVDDLCLDDVSSNNSSNTSNSTSTSTDSSKALGTRMDESSEIRAVVGKKAPDFKNSKNVPGATPKTPKAVPTNATLKATSKVTL